MYVCIYLYPSSSYRGIVARAVVVHWGINVEKKTNKNVRPKRKVKPQRPCFVCVFGITPVMRKVCCPMSRCHDSNPCEANSLANGDDDDAEKGLPPSGHYSAMATRDFWFLRIGLFLLEFRRRY